MSRGPGRTMRWVVAELAAEEPGRWVPARRLLLARTCGQPTRGQDETIRYAIRALAARGAVEARHDWRGRLQARLPLSGEALLREEAARAEEAEQWARLLALFDAA